MTTPRTRAAGWYADPTGRHQQRLWDGAAWTTTVSDQNVTSVDVVDAGRSAARSAASGYRAVAVPTWRPAALYTASLIALAAFIFEVIASVNLRASTDELSRWAWLYRDDPTGALYGYPPIGLWVTLLLTPILASSLLLPPAQALKKSGLPVMWQWSAPTERRRLAGGLASMRTSRTLLRGRGGTTLAALTLLPALLVVGLSGYALLAHRGVLAETGTTAQTSSQDLAVGLGPKVCLLAGLLAAVLVLLAWPWRHAAPNVLVLPDGSIEREPAQDRA